MEVSVAFLMDVKDKASADFIALMWDEENSPVEVEEVEPAYHQAFNALEYLDYPTAYDRDSDTRLLGFFEVLNSLDTSETISELILPYREAGAVRMLVVLSGEVYEWVEVDAKGMRYVKAKPFLKGDDTSDLFEQLRNVAAGLWKE